MKHLTMGIDVGSSSVKVAVTESEAGNAATLVAMAVQRIRRRNVREVSEAAIAEACAIAKLPHPASERSPYDYVASTGEAELLDGLTGHFYGMTAHARGALFFDAGAVSALDVGALHARAIRMDPRGKVLGHRMTSQCASGSGQFIENIARYLGVPLEEVGALSRASEGAEEVSSICAVLAETDVINMVSRGLKPAEILRGIHLSLGGRLVRLLRAISADGKVVLTGGLSADEGLVAALQELLGKERRPKGGASTIVSDPRAIAAGAIGAALLGARRVDQLGRSRSSAQPIATG